MSQLQNRGLMSDPMICDVLMGLHRSLNRALKLDIKCQKQNNILHFFTAKEMVNQLHRVQDDIHSKIQHGNLAITTYMMDVSLWSYSRTGGPWPLLTSTNY
jgi:hypothetical protein